MNTKHENPNRSAASIVEFCRFARSKGIPVGIQQVLAAAEAASTVGVADSDRFSFALRAALCSSQEEWEKFRHIFDEFWRQPHGAPDAEKVREPRYRNAMKQSNDARLLIGLESDTNSSGEGDGRLVSGASSEQRLKRVDFSEASSAQMAELERLALRLLRQMSVRLSRRMKIDTEGNRIDIRRSIRRNITRGGDPLVLAYKSRKASKKRLVVFLDISGSMNLYSLFLLRFAYALQKHFKRVNTFLFSTRVVEVTDLLRAPQLSRAMSGVAQRAPEWSGGTRIGACLCEFNRGAGRKIPTRDTCFVILSDGWDTGAPEVLAAELRVTRGRVQKLLWLNPLLGLKDYQPITRGIRAALPYVDRFAAAHNLESLLALEKYL